MNYFYFIGGIIALFVILKILSLPIKIIGKFIVNSIIGGIAFYFLAKIGIIILITWWTILLVGFLGIPGVVLVVILSMIL